MWKIQKHAGGFLSHCISMQIYVDPVPILRSLWWMQHKKYGARLLSFLIQALRRRLTPWGKRAREFIF
jgi:hypothetical protein